MEKFQVTMKDLKPGMVFLSENYFDLVVSTHHDPRDRVLYRGQPLGQHVTSLRVEKKNHTIYLHHMYGATYDEIYHNSFWELITT